LLNICQHVSDSANDESVHQKLQNKKLANVPVLIFCLCNKIPEKTTQVGRINFDSQFQSFLSMVGWFHVSRPMLRESIMATRTCDRGYLPQSGQEAEKR
jgi:hypothetical protein